MAKNSARKNFHCDPSTFLNSVQVHNSVIRQQAQATAQRNLLAEEKKFKANCCITAMTASIKNVRNMHRPCFLDLANAFGSVSPSAHPRKLKAFVSTPDWSTDSFTVQRGVFRGDRLSPVTIPLCFDPLIKLATQHPSKGYVPCIPVPDSSHFHPSMPPSTCYEMMNPPQSRQDGTNARCQPTW